MSELLQQIVDKEVEILPDKQYFRDGGTIGFSVKDGEGKIHQLYIDGKIDSTTKDVFFSGNLPGYPDSEELGRNDELAKIIREN